MILQHYTIDTGHCRESDRREVSDDVIASLASLLRAGEHEMPSPPGGYRLRVTQDGTVLAATVLSSAGAPLATMFACVDDAGIKAAVLASGAKPAVSLRAPAVLATLHPTISLDISATGWLGDFERCLAWAWLEREAGS